MSSLRISLTLAALSSLAVACGSEPEPKPIVAATPPIATTNDTGPVRTVGYRNPLGHMQVTGNLFADGDFELTGRSGQMPWIAFGNNGQGTLNYATGGQCYSGIRCASLAKGSAMIGYMASPPTGSVDVTVKVRTQTGKCADVTMAVIDQGENGPQSSLFAGAPTPDGTGWCRYRGTMKGFAKLQPVLYVTTKADAGILVDDAIAVPLDGQYVLSEGEPAPADFLAEARVAMRWIREHRIFGIPKHPNVDTPPKSLLPPGTE
jgi:hypothetical protein